jgi:hypothetical protein
MHPALHGVFMNVYVVVKRLRAAGAYGAFFRPQEKGSCRKRQSYSFSAFPSVQRLVCGQLFGSAKAAAGAESEIRQALCIPWWWLESLSSELGDFS